MILVKAKMLRCSVEDKVFEGKTSRNYVFHCQRTDLDGSTIPVVLTTKNLESSKILEDLLKDKSFHLVPISNARVNTFSLNGNLTYNLDDSIVLHPDFRKLDSLMVSPSSLPSSSIKSA